MLTAVLTATLDDSNGIPRLPILLSSLSKFAHSTTFYELIIIVPDAQKLRFEMAFIKDNTEELLSTFYTYGAQRELGFAKQQYPVRIVSDEELLSVSRSRFEALTPLQVPDLICSSLKTESIMLAA